jgi:hypothetical protein
MFFSRMLQVLDSGRELIYDIIPAVSRQSKWIANDQQLLLADEAARE